MYAAAMVSGSNEGRITGPVCCKPLGNRNLKGLFGKRLGNFYVHRNSPQACLKIPPAHRNSSVSLRRC